MGKCFSTEAVTVGFCLNCGSSVGEGARFCSNCGKALATPQGVRTESTKREVASLDDVPWWLGWLAIPIGALTSIIGLWLYSYWAYRRGRRNGIALDPVEQPYDNFGWRIVGWSIASLVPILHWFVAVHLPTICYKHGLRVGAKQGTAPEGFTSLPALAAALGGMVLVALAASFTAGLVLAMTEETESADTIPSSSPLHVKIDEPLYSRDTIIYLVAKSICPRQPSWAQARLGGNVTARYVGDGIWRVSSQTGRSPPAIWEVNEMTGYVAPKNDAAHLLHAFAELGVRCH